MQGEHLPFFAAFINYEEIYMPHARAEVPLSSTVRALHKASVYNSSPHELDAPMILITRVS